ncbi:MAG: NYN domain-containing protein [Chloroflexi bacterium]|nr:NYN domain-containing protein [Chloroflexota bacterium]
MRRDLPLVALLIDYDNLEIGASYDLPGRPLDLGCVIELAQRYGTVIVARAYADWSDPGERLAVYESGIEPCYAPVFRTSPGEPGKSLADTVLVADGVDILWRVAPDYLVLVTSDKDILPLARLARLRGTKTIVVGSDRTALPLRRLADEYVSYRDLVRGTGVPVATHQRAGLVPLSRGPLSAPATEGRGGPRLVAEARPAGELRRTTEPRVSNGTTPAPVPEAVPPEGSTAPRRRRRRRRGAGAAAAPAAAPTPAETVEQPAPPSAVEAAVEGELSIREAEVEDAVAAGPELVAEPEGAEPAATSEEPAAPAAAEPTQPQRPIAPPATVQRSAHAFGSFEPPPSPPRPTAEPEQAAEPALDQAARERPEPPSLEATPDAEPAPELASAEIPPPVLDGATTERVEEPGPPAEAAPAPRRRRRTAPRARQPAAPAATASEVGPS